MNEDWEAPLKQFAADVQQMNLSISIKIHIVDRHFAEFLKNHARGVSLAAYSEQAMEACHYSFKGFEKRAGISKNYRKLAPERVLKAVLLWNSSRLTYSQCSKLIRFRSHGRQARADLSQSGSPHIDEGPHSSVKELTSVFRVHFVV